MTEAKVLSRVPNRLMVSGEGLRLLNRPQFDAMVGLLAILGIKVEFEEPPADIGLTIGDFHRYATEHGIIKGQATRAFNALNRQWYTRRLAREELDNGREVPAFWIEYLEDPAWMDDIGIDDDTLSYYQVKAAYADGRLAELAGGKTLEFFTGFLAHIEAEQAAVGNQAD